ncbi:MAG: signal transduction histidine kinase LytS [Gemmatimonadetes bacterium]|nr:signal transduction histidine kinase LytS [Gemmatimonadota bacterium]
MTAVEAAAANAPDRRSPWRPWAVALAVWALIGTGTAVQRWWGNVLLGSPSFLGDELRTSLPRYLIWGALTPLVWVLSRRFPVAGRGAWRHVLVHLAGCAAYVAVQTVAFTLAALAYAGIRRMPGAAVFGMTLLGYLPYDVVLYLAVAGVYHAVTYHRAYVARAVKDAQLETRLAQTELDALRAHLQPRFLFGSLDAVSGLMESDVRGARKALADLSELLRLSLNEGGGRPVPLSDELDLLERYFAVRAMSRGGAVRLRLSVPDSVRDTLVPPALLQPLADQLLSGAGPADAAARLEVSAARVPGGLRLSLRVDGPRPPAADDGAGLLDAVEARLVRICGEGATLRRDTAAGSGICVHVHIPEGWAFRTA